MRRGESNTTVIVGGERVLAVRTVATDPPHKMQVEVSIDGQAVGVYEEAGWQALAFGVARDLIYWWSARRVGVLAPPAMEPTFVTSDEDLKFVFAANDGWILVCETSVKRLSDEGEVWRFNSADVIVDAHWDGSELLIRDFGGTVSRHRPM